MRPSRSPHWSTLRIAFGRRPICATRTCAWNRPWPSCRVAQQQIVEQDRIGALGHLASGIAHDFNNALGPILGYSDLLLANPQQLANVEVVTEYIRAINTAAEGAAGVVSRLRDFYRRRL